MGRIFGRKGCKEDRSWQIKIHTVDDDYTKVTEQLSRKNAVDLLVKSLN